MCLCVCLCVCSFACFFFLFCVALYSYVLCCVVLFGWVFVVVRSADYRRTVNVLTVSYGLIGKDSSTDDLPEQIGTTN